MRGSTSRDNPQGRSHQSDEAIHDVVMFDKGTADEQAAFFLHPEPRIFILHGEDITLQTNY